MATEKIKSNKWNYHNSATGKTPINISSLDCDELFIQVDANNSGNKEAFYIPKRILSASNNWFRMGGRGNGDTDSGLITIRASTSEVALVTCYLNGQDYATGSVTQVFYR